MPMLVNEGDFDFSGGRPGPRPRLVMGLDKLPFLHSYNMTSPDLQPQPAAPDAEVRPEAQIPRAPVPLTRISTGYGWLELRGVARASPLPAWLQLCLCKHLFLKNDFCYLAGMSSSQSLSLCPFPPCTPLVLTCGAACLDSDFYRDLKLDKNGFSRGDQDTVTILEFCSLPEAQSAIGKAVGFVASNVAEKAPFNREGKGRNPFAPLDTSHCLMKTN